MTVRMGANGMPIPEKKTETLQEILEVNPNVEVEEVEEDTTPSSHEWEAEEVEEDDEDEEV